MRRLLAASKALVRVHQELEKHDDIIPKHTRKVAPQELPGWSHRHTFIFILVALHVAGLGYYGYIFISRKITKAKLREPPKAVNCVYEWASLPVLSWKQKQNGTPSNANIEHYIARMPFTMGSSPPKLAGH